MLDSTRIAGRFTTRLRLGLVLLGVTPAATLVAFWLTRDDAALELWLARVLFWSMPCVLGFAAVGAVANSWGRDEPVRARFAGAALGLSYALALTVVLFAWVSPQLRVQFDETSVLGASQNMLRHEACLVTTGALPVDGDVFPRENTIDKRPPLFAFLVHVLHRVTGYRIANAYWVNGMLLILGLFTAFQMVRARFGLPAALAAPLCLLSVPLIAVTATSAGFDLMATVWLLVAVRAASDLVRQPDRGRWCWFLAAAMLLAQSRYESLLVALCLVAMVFLRMRGKYRPDGLGAAMLALWPALTVPPVLLLLHARNPKFYPEAGGEPLFHATYFAEHAGHLLSEWFSVGLGNPYPGVLAGIGLVACSVHLWKSKSGFTSGVMAVVVLVTTGIALAWFYGDAREQTAARLFLPLGWATGGLAVVVFQWLGPRLAIVGVIIAAAFCGVRVRELANGNAFPQMPIAGVTKELDEIVQRIPCERSTTLWVGAPAQHLIINGYAALTADGFVRRKTDLQRLASQGDLLTVYFLQTTIDDQLAAALGYVAELLPLVPVEVVAREWSGQSVVVHRMQH